MSFAPTTSYTQEDIRAGFIAALCAYLFWGLLPIYIKLVGFADPREILGQRILWAAPTAALGVLALNGWRRGLSELRAAMRPGLIGTLALSSLFIFCNWALYVWAVATNHVLEAALAYFIAPLVQVAIGVAFFSERVSKAQWAALGFAAAGVVVQGAALGAFPWVSLLLCATWCAYAVVRRRANVPAATGMLIETVMLFAPAAALLAWVGPALTFSNGPGNALMLALAGPATVIPLTLFAFGARRLTFSAIGLLQYIAPTLQFLVGVAYGESLNPLRIASFALIWVGLALFSFDAWRKERLKS
jgi:chloramphenicol-sensitive protein RarD